MACSGLLWAAQRHLKDVCTLMLFVTQGFVEGSEACHSKHESNGYLTYGPHYIHVCVDLISKCIHIITCQCIEMFTQITEKLTLSCPGHRFRFCCSLLFLLCVLIDALMFFWFFEWYAGCLALSKVVCPGRPGFNFHQVTSSLQLHTFSVLPAYVHGVAELISATPNLHTFS